MKRKNLPELYPDCWAHCSFCNGAFPIERGLLNRKNRPRINRETGLCTNCEKLRDVTIKQAGILHKNILKD
jgi:hypothetical protein